MGNAIPLETFNHSQKLMLYHKCNKDVLNRLAVFSDETKDYRTPTEPKAYEWVKIYLRTAADNVDQAFLICGDAQIPMKKDYTKGIFDYYSVMLEPDKDIRRYYFEIRKNEDIWYYTKQGVSREAHEEFYFMLISNFTMPEWTKGAVMYQIYIDRFYNGNKKNDVQDREYMYLGKPVHNVTDWDEMPKADDIRNFYGGDLQGVIEKMGYLKDLGIEVIYFNPLFVSPSNHKYDIQDYDHIDPHLGEILEDGGEVLAEGDDNNLHASKYIQRTTQQVNLEASDKLFIRLVETAHQNGIRVILDGVFNHCGAFNKWLDREKLYKNAGDYPPGAFEAKDSPYHDYFKWYDGGTWPDNASYDGWWGHSNHPKLHYETSEGLYQYILQVAKKWVSPPFNVDGWRLDVAADLGMSEDFNHKFWKDFRQAVKEANPSAIIIAEHYGSAEKWLLGDEWDTVMNYDAFMEPITWFLTGMEKHSDRFSGELYCNGQVFEESMRWHMARMPYQSLFTAMNELSNHDHSRFLTRTNKTAGRLHTSGSETAGEHINKGIFKEGVIFQMTWPGCPTVYYGDEAGVVGWTDPDNRRTYPWGNEDLILIEFHREAIRIHKSYQALKTGSLKLIRTEYGILSYARFDKENSLVIVLNNNDVPKQLEIPVWIAEVALNGKMKSLMFTDQQGYSTEPGIYPVEKGILKLILPPFSSMILLEVR